MNRMRLPNRRYSEQIEFMHQGLRCLASVGRYQDGKIGEVFLRVGEKHDSAADIAARDMTIAASIGLQYGVDINSLRNSLSRDSAGNPMSPLCTLLDKLAAEADEEEVIKPVEMKMAANDTVIRAVDAPQSRSAEARAKGYEGEACPECQNYTLVRNGTCMKCNTCGSTTGCS